MNPEENNNGSSHSAASVPSAGSPDAPDTQPVGTLVDADLKEDNNGTDIQPPDHVYTDSGDSASVSPKPSGVDIQPESLEGADLGASKPIPEPKPTLAQVKAWRAANFTVRHSTVNACGHKLDLRNFPSNANCEDCWEAFFSVSPEGIASVHDLLLKAGTKAVIALHGAKFTKMFGKFLQKKLLSQAVQATSGIEGSIMDLSQIEHCRENG